MCSLEQAKAALDTIIKKSRVHLYKPIQIAEILYKHRVDTSNSVVLKDLETYRKESKHWRDIICMQFLGRVSTSSAKYQDNVFDANAIPPKILSVLGQENKKHNGVVEAYIYQAFENKHKQLNEALKYVLNSSTDSFELQVFLDQFWVQPGLKRSIDKIFEIVVYSLFEVLTLAIGVNIDIYYDISSKAILEEFSEFAKKVLNLTPDNDRKTLKASFHRVGVTNAADRGLDIYANFGSVVQVKHLALNEGVAESVVTSITSDRIIIVCKNAEAEVIHSLLTQIGWQSRIQSIITVDELVLWYKKAFQGKHSHLFARSLLSTLSTEIKNEFPSVGNDDFQNFKRTRGYDKLESEFWFVNI